MFHIMWQDGTDAGLNIWSENSRIHQGVGSCEIYRISWWYARLTNAVGAVGEKTIHSLEAVGDSTTRATTKVCLSWILLYWCDCRWSEQLAERLPELLIVSSVLVLIDHSLVIYLGAMGSVGSSSKHAFSAVGKATGSMTSKLKRSSQATHESNSNDDSNH